MPGLLVGRRINDGGDHAAIDELGAGRTRKLLGPKRICPSSRSQADIAAAARKQHRHGRGLLRRASEEVTGSRRAASAASRSPGRGAREATTAQNEYRQRFHGLILDRLRWGVAIIAALVGSTGHDSHAGEARTVCRNAGIQELEGRAAYRAIVLPKAAKLEALAHVPFRETLAAALARRKKKLDDLAKSPIATDLPHGGLASWVMLDPAQSVFDQQTALRKAMQLVLAEKPETLLVAVYGGAAAPARGGARGLCGVGQRRAPARAQEEARRGGAAVGAAARLPRAGRFCRTAGGRRRQPAVPRADGAAAQRADAAAAIASA